MRSGSLPSAQNTSAQFFSSLMGFNASHNRLSGTIPDDWARAAFFSSSGPLHSFQLETSGSNPGLRARHKDNYFFDVRSNALTGMLPSFFQSGLPTIVDPADYVHTEVRRQKPKRVFRQTKYLVWSGTALSRRRNSSRQSDACGLEQPSAMLPTFFSNNVPWLLDSARACQRAPHQHGMEL